METAFYRELDQRRERENDFNPDEINERIKDRYKSYDQEYQGDAQHVPMQFLLPTPKDPNLWLVRCKVLLTHNYKCIRYSIPVYLLKKFRFIETSFHIAFSYRWIVFPVSNFYEIMSLSRDRRSFLHRSNNLLFHLAWVFQISIAWPRT
jgi:hypothetical protein